MPANTRGSGGDLLLLPATLLAGLQALQIKLAQLSDCLELSSIYKWKYIWIYKTISLGLPWSELIKKKIISFTESSWGVFPGSLENSVRPLDPKCA